MPAKVILYIASTLDGYIAGPDGEMDWLLSYEDGGHGYEEIDARTYAAWGIDLLKYDYCFAPSARTAAEDRYGAMGRALQTSGRSIVLSVCEWGFRKPWEWAPGLGGSYWRTTPDIFDSFGWSWTYWVWEDGFADSEAAAALTRKIAIAEASAAPQVWLAVGKQLLEREPVPHLSGLGVSLTGLLPLRQVQGALF